MFVPDGNVTISASPLPDIVPVPVQLPEKSFVFDSTTAVSCPQHIFPNPYDVLDELEDKELELEENELELLELELSELELDEELELLELEENELELLELELSELELELDEELELLELELLEHE